MITSDNFCHVEQVEDGVKVLFFVEHDGDDIVLHQVTSLEVGTLDLKVSLPADKFEALWPDSIQFPDAARKVLATARELGFAPRLDGCPLSSSGGTDAL